MNQFGYSKNTKLECGISKSIPNIFNKYCSKWKEKNTFSICTWNIWGAAHFDNISLIKKRLPYIIQELKNNNNDIICLQEVSQSIIDELCYTDFIKNNYYISSVKQPWKSKKVKLDNSAYNGYEPNCWCVILSKFAVIKSDHLILKSDLLEFSTVIADLGFVTIVNLHLQSGGMGSGKDYKSGIIYHQCRKTQMKEIKKFVKDNYNNKSVIYLGDFNCDLNTNKLFPETKNITNNLIDSWTYLKNKGLDGTTENTYINTMRYNIKKLHKNFRYDGILYNSDKINAIESTIFGLESIFEISSNAFKKIYNYEPIIVNKNDNVDWFLSDHFGLITTFEFI